MVWSQMSHFHFHLTDLEVIDRKIIYLVVKKASLIITENDLEVEGNTV